MTRKERKVKIKVAVLFVVEHHLVWQGVLELSKLSCNPKVGEFVTPASADIPASRVLGFWTWGIHCPEQTPDAFWLRWAMRAFTSNNLSLLRTHRVV